MAPSLTPKIYIFKSRLKQLTFLTALVLFFSSNAYAQTVPVVRVALIRDAKSLSIKISGFYEIIRPQTGKVLYRGKDLFTTAKVYQGNIFLGKNALSGTKLLLRASKDLAISVNNRKFRGDIVLVSGDKQLLSVVNNINLEDYIKGILYHEASHYWPLEALKAQAIACRTYALYQVQGNASRDWDVTSDVYSQVYGGRTSERYRTNRAVDETRGLALVYQNKIFPAYFHATCGGATEDAGMLWNNSIPPLKGVVCGFCKESPHFSWHAVLSLEELEKALNKSGYKIKGIKEIHIEGRDRSDRIANLKITTENNSWTIPAKDFRMIVGVNAIRSTNFTVQIKDGDVVFEGRGWGHGVGLCQWGAYFMAKQGRSYEEILKYYYPGAQVLRH